MYLFRECVIYLLRSLIYSCNYTLLFVRYCSIRVFYYNWFRIFVGIRIIVFYVHLIRSLELQVSGTDNLHYDFFRWNFRLIFLLLQYIGRLHTISTFIRQSFLFIVQIISYKLIAWNDAITKRREKNPIWPP